MRNLISFDTIFDRPRDDTIELLKAWAGTTLAFAIMQTGASNLISGAFVLNLVVAAIVAGVGFVLHELAHRIVARGYGAEAHFIANDRWLLLSILISLLGIFIAAPGAVWHRGLLTVRQSGLIALAGPVTNLVLSILFLLLFVPIIVLRPPFFDLWITVCYVGFRFNAWIGLFNMIPAGPFDGAKVLAWDWRVFAVTVAVGIGLTFLLSDSMIFSVLWALAQML
ncbi:MAG: peptidase M50 [Chloroflexus sp.]|uniref:M50 family metallopeptidase n=1 Tax=Chloroflexus sp. TaxID=1904827 RepID=UPI0021DC5F87|nr:M50 family metallopeptidase [Chloroflexus sp.]GIV90117.1 MAG: peptidase M50 [Chloroflexus sp.]